jgi:hypothetical protein
MIVGYTRSNTAGCTTIVAYVATRRILEECQRGERGCGLMPQQWWWEHVVDLDINNAIGSDE